MKTNKWKLLNWLQFRKSHSFLFRSRFFATMPKKGKNGAGMTLQNYNSAVKTHKEMTIEWSTICKDHSCKLCFWKKEITQPM